MPSETRLDTMKDSIHSGAVIDALAALPAAQRRAVVRTFYASAAPSSAQPITDPAALRRLHLGIHNLRALLDG